MATLRKLFITDWLALAILLLYIIAFSALTIRRHNAFNTNALDLAKFDQSIWNTAQGRPYQITIGENLVLDSHFSPSLALALLSKEDMSLLVAAFGLYDSASGAALPDSNGQVYRLLPAQPPLR